MRKLLLGLWLLGAGLYTINTLVLTHTISGSPEQSAEDSAQTLLLPREKQATIARASPPDGTAPLPSEEPDPRLRAERKVLQDRLAEARNGLPGESSPPVPADDSEPYQLAQGEAEQGESAGAPVEEPSAAPLREEDGSGTMAPEDPAARDEGVFLGDRVFPTEEQDSATLGEEQAEWVTVSSRGANIRSGPSRSAQRVGSAPPATELRVIGRERGWAEVADESGASIGWIYEGLLKTVSEDGFAGEEADTAGDQSEPVAVRKYKRPRKAGRRIGRGFAGAVRRAIGSF